MKLVEPAPASLAHQTLLRLRKVAQGNGIAPGAIEVVTAEEKVYELTGTLQLKPFCEQAGGGRYPGRPRGAGRQMLGSFGELHAEAQRRQQQFKDSRDWIAEVLTYVKDKMPAQGWGQHDERIGLPEKSVILAATEACPACQGRQTLTCQQCQGQGFVICVQCQGRGQELCYNCSGRGENPLQPGQACVICQGTRHAPCRFCRSTGKLVCPTCQGRRGTPCGACQGSGFITEEIALACGVVAHFNFRGEDLPSGLRRGLDRAGISNLGNGYADIQLIEAKGEDEKNSEKPELKPELHYRALLPYADLKIRIGDNKRVTIVSVFGKRCALMGIPAFLDETLRPWRERLKQAVQGRTKIEDAIEARALREALELVLAGQGKLENLRRLYPVGLSAEAMKEILGNLGRALKRLTLHVRSAAAVLFGLISAGIFAAIFLANLGPRLMQGWPPAAQPIFDLALPVILMSLSWIGLNKSVQFALRRQFPAQKIPLLQNTGKTCTVMLAGIALAYVAILFLMPTKPVWLSYIMRIINPIFPKI